MSDFEDKLNSILSSPADMEKIFNLARSISGSSSEQEEQEAKPAEPSGSSMPFGDFDPRMLTMMSRLMKEYGSAGSDKKQLMDAMKPYLKAKRHSQIDKAVQIAKMAHLAKIAFSEFSGGDNNL